MLSVENDVHVKTILLATKNEKKREEIKEILKCLPGVRLRGIEDFPFTPEIEEDGKTFQENAIKKAMIMAKSCNTWAMADDSGLVIDALNGKPGIYSSRYAGPNATDQENIKKVLSELSGVQKEKRTARFVCAVALASPHELLFVVEGDCEGLITSEPRGEHGFGYDPIFLAPYYNQTFAELGGSIQGVKNKISHRANALQNFKERLIPLIENL